MRKAVRRVGSACLADLVLDRFGVVVAVVPVDVGDLEIAGQLGEPGISLFDRMRQLMQ